MLPWLSVLWDAFAEVKMAPPPDEGLLLRVESDGIVQWFLPANPPPNELLAARKPSPRRRCASRFRCRC